MEQEITFEALLDKHRVIIERYINFRIPSRSDADDVIQETYCAAYIGFPQLQNKELFKFWMLSIAKNQCNIWFRKKYKVDIIPLESAFESIDDIADKPIQHDDNEAIFDILKLMPRQSAKLLRLTMQGYKQISIFEKGRKNITQKNHTCGFPSEMPALIIKESARPFVEIKCADECFIIPKIGNKNSEGTYRYPDKKLAFVSTCYVPKADVIHDAVGVKICRDTYNVKRKKLHKNECVWFSQLTDEYVRDLGYLIYNEADDDEPTEIHTFLEENYDVIVNCNDKVHGRPLLIKENPPQIIDGKIFIDEYNIRYTMGSYDVTIGDKTFETIKFINVQNNTLITENYVDMNGRLVFLRWYESVDCIMQTEGYTHEFRQSTANNPKLIVNDIEYRLIEDRISEYAL